MDLIPGKIEHCKVKLFWQITEAGQFQEDINQKQQLLLISITIKTRAALLRWQYKCVNKLEYKAILSSVSIH